MNRKAKRVVAGGVAVAIVAWLCSCTAQEVGDYRSSVGLAPLPQITSAGDPAEEARDIVGTVQTGIETAAPFVPEPGRSLLGIGIALAGWIRAYQNRKTTRMMVAAIDQAKSPDGVVDFSTRSTRHALDRAMGARGKRVVDEVQGKVRTLPV